MATLHILTSDDPQVRGRAIELPGGVFIIGRDPSQSLSIDENAVSRRHASITYTTGGYVLTDEGSANGVFINGTRVTQHVLRPGDVIGIGATTMRFDVAAQHVAQPVVAQPSAGPSGCAIGCLIASIVLLLGTIAASAYVLYRF